MQIVGFPMRRLICLPCIASPKILQFVSFRIMKTIATILTVSVIGINLFFVAVYIQKLPSRWWLYTILAVLVVLYMMFVIYLVSE